MKGLEYIERIAAYEPRPYDGRTFTSAIGSLALDKHDVRGMIFLAGEALTAIDEDDPYRPAFERIVEFARKDHRYDHHDGEGILTICRQAKAEFQGLDPSIRP